MPQVARGEGKVTGQTKAVMWTGSRVKAKQDGPEAAATVDDKGSESTPQIYLSYFLIF